MEISTADVRAHVKDMVLNDRSKILLHYMVHDCFLQDNHILKNIATIKHIPMYIVNARQDLVCPPISAYALHKAVPYSKLVIVPGGHRMTESIKRPAIREMIDWFSRHSFHL
jgi:proline iminopeptidase